MEAGIAALLLALGIASLVYGALAWLRAGRLLEAQLARTGEVAADDGRIRPGATVAVEGAASSPQPLTAPVSGTTCFFYSIRVTASWRDGNRRRTKELTRERRAAPFAIDDGSGPVWVDAAEGGDFEPEESMSQTRSTSLVGGITGQDLLFGTYRVPLGALSLGASYRVDEAVLPALARAHVCGKVGRSREIGAPASRRLLVTAASRDDYLARGKRAAGAALVAGVALVALGSALAALHGVR